MMEVMIGNVRMFPDLEPENGGVSDPRSGEIPVPDDPKFPRDLKERIEGIHNDNVQVEIKGAPF